MTPSRRLSFLRAVGWGLCCVSVALLTFTVAFAQGPTAPPRRGPAPHRLPAPPKSAHPQPPRPHFPGRPEETIHVKKTLPLPPVREGDRPYKKTPHLDQRVGNLRFVLDRFERDDKVTCDLTVSGGKPGWTRRCKRTHVGVCSSGTGSPSSMDRLGERTGRSLLGAGQGQRKAGGGGFRMPAPLLG